MILLDTNIISELMRPAPNASVQAWIDDRSPSEIGTTVICYAEILYGIATLPEGRRSREMHAAAERIFLELFKDALLPFDASAATVYAELAAEHRRTGRTVGILDLQIAAIARAHDAPLATRNIRHFTDCGIELIDPFTPTAGPTAGR